MGLIRYRIIYLVGLALTVVLGLASRAWPIGWYLWDKSLGDALYAVAAYWVLRFVLPTLRVFTAAGLTLGFCLGVEAFKFTGLPTAWAQSRVSRLLFGTTPSWHNVLCYAVAVTVVAMLEMWVRRDRTGQL